MKNWHKLLISSTYLAILIAPHLLRGGWGEWILPLLHK